MDLPNRFVCIAEATSKKHVSALLFYVCNIGDDIPVPIQALLVTQGLPAPKGAGSLAPESRSSAPPKLPLRLLPELGGLPNFKLPSPVRNHLSYMLRSAKQLQYTNTTPKQGLDSFL